MQSVLLESKRLEFHKNLHTENKHLAFFFFLTIKQIFLVKNSSNNYNKKICSTYSSEKYEMKNLMLSHPAFILLRK